MMIDSIQLGQNNYAAVPRPPLSILPPPHVLAPDVMNPKPLQYYQPMPYYQPPSPPYYPPAASFQPPPPKPPVASSPLPEAPMPPQQDKPAPISLAKIAQGLSGNDNGLRKQALEDLNRLVADNPDFQRPKVASPAEKLILMALRNNEGAKLIEVLGTLNALHQATPNIQLELRKIRNVAERQTNGNPFSMAGFVADLSNTVLSKFASNKSTASGFNTVESSLPAMPLLAGIDKATEAQMKAFENEMAFGS